MKVCYNPIKSSNARFLFAGDTFLMQLIYALTMTYGIEWNSKPSQSDEVKKKKDNISDSSESYPELLDLPAELLVIILNKLGYQELRSIEASCSYLRYIHEEIIYLITLRFLFQGDDNRTPVL